MSRQSRLPLERTKAQNALHDPSRLHHRRLRAVRGARPFATGRSPARSSTSAPCVPPAATSDRRRAGIALCLCQPAGLASWRSSPRRPTPRARRHDPARAALRAGRGRLLGDRRPRAVRRAGARTRGAARARRCAAASRARRLVLGAGYSAQSGFFFSALQHIDVVADLAAALHVPRARLLRRGRARPRAPRPVEGARARARQRRHRARPAWRRRRQARGDGRAARPRRRRDVQRLHLGRRRDRRPDRRVAVQRARRDRRGDRS